jgi:hypothetical protein
VIPYFEDGLIFFTDGAILIGCPIDIVNWSGLQYGACFQAMVLDKVSVDEHACGATVQQG